MQNALQRTDSEVTLVNEYVELPGRKARGLE